MKLTIAGKVYETESPKPLRLIAEELGYENVLAATVDMRLRELSYLPTGDAEVTFLDYTHSDSISIYEATLRYVIAKAVKNLFPHAKLRYNYSISRSILAVFDRFDGVLNETTLKQIHDEVDRIIQADYPINRRRISIGEAHLIYEGLDMMDKVDVLQYRDEDYVNLYECNDYMNYMFGYMLPSTGYLKAYELMLYHPGFLIRYPRPELGGEIPPFEDEQMFGLALKDAAKWGRIISGNTIAKMNTFAKQRKSSIDFVNMCETKHNHQLNELGTLIEDNIDNIRIIGIAGPSSSGKTTFSNRLRIELMTRGIRPLMISIDDYYLGRHQAPKNEDGTPDLEHIDALDVDLFNNDMLKLIRGETVTLPKFNFLTGKREAGLTVEIAEDQPIIIEGIHALNDKLTFAIPKHQKYNIYISPQTQLHIDDHNPISITNLRLLRRLVRDQKYRNASAGDTMDMWPSVRRGEFQWIYPHQKHADYVFNSELTYELAVLKKHAIKQLRAIPTNDKHFITANKLIKFLKYFIDIDDDIVPNNSLLREFIGGSPFNDE
ncbi:MAG: hypothetical protein WC225_03795 [Acholeplasmataceae bacterium]|nr:hypothetical protein [Acholeplasmataceae bacterium]